MDQNAFAKLEGRDFEYFMNKRRIAIGRDSKLGSVDVNMGSTRFISRKHLEISVEGNRFYLLCRGKNGIFVDDIFQRREAKRMQLPFSCIIRFPSTAIKLGFTSLIEDNGYHIDARPTSPLPPSSAFQSPYVTPLPSPTGTISVVNSCPTSPRGMMIHQPRIPSIDLMAQYASKLLSQQQQQNSDSEAVGDGTSNNLHNEGNEARAEEAIGSSGSSSPANTSPVPVEKEEAVTSSSVTNESSTADERIGKDGRKYVKPPFSYAQLIVQALLASSDRRQTLSNIYQFISEKYPYYRLEDKGWKNSIRHNLSLNQYFMKAPREREGLGFGKGGYWCMHPDYEEKLTSQAYVKRKKKGIPVFPSAGLMSRSAPPSPTHHPFMPDLNLKDHENPFVVRPTASHAHFTLPSFLPPRLPQTASHSLPASPNRLPHVPGGGAFHSTPLRFYPLGISTSTEALALESRQRAREKGDLLPSKRPCLSGEVESSGPTHMTPVIMGGAGPSLVATGAPQAAACFPLPQQRFPFMGMPLLAQPSLLTATPFMPPSVQPAAIIEQSEEEKKEEKRGEEEAEREEKS